MIAFETTACVLPIPGLPDEVFANRALLPNWVLVVHTSYPSLLVITTSRGYPPRPTPEYGRCEYMEDPIPKLITVEGLSDLLSIPVGTIYRWRSLGVGPKGIRIGKFVRYDPREVEKWLRERGGYEPAACSAVSPTRTNAERRQRATSENVSGVASPPGTADPVGQ